MTQVVSIHRATHLFLPKLGTQCECEKAYSSAHRLLPIWVAPPSIARRMSNLLRPYQASCQTHHTFHTILSGCTAHRRLFLCPIFSYHIYAHRNTKSIAFISSFIEMPTPWKKSTTGQIYRRIISNLKRKKSSNPKINRTEKNAL